MSKYTHIFFDLDHTLWDFHSNSVETLGELYEQFDLAEITRSPSQAYFIERYIYHNDRMWGLYRRNRMSKSRLRKARFEAALHDVGLDDKRLAKQIGNAYLDVCPRKTKLNEGAEEVLEMLISDYTLHIISNGFHETQMIKMECSGLAKYFSEVITSEKANAKKPDPRIFEYAERRTNAPKDQSLMIGDNLEIDIRGAYEFGWDVIHFNEEGTQHEFKSVSRLNELPALIIGK